jgi:hypothetical protein
MTTDLYQAAKAALDALEHLDKVSPGPVAREEIAMLRDTLKNNEYAYQRGYIGGRVKPIEAALKPLTDDQIGLAWSVANGEHSASAAVKRRITRAIEAAHGIKEQT